MMQQMLLSGSQSEHTVTVDDYTANVANGNHNFTRTATVTGEVGPLTYLWFWASGGVGIALTNTTSATCTLDSTGTDQTRDGVLQCDVTDTGNGNLVRSDTGAITVNHGTPP